MNEKKRVYLIAIYPDPDGGFLARFPDFPELAADYGKDFEDCVLQSSRFLDDVIADKVERGKPLPEPSPVEKIRGLLDPENGEPLCVVPVTVYPPAKTQRINITGKGDIFARIDDYARRHHITRSDLMVSATLDYIRKRG